MDSVGSKEKGSPAGEECGFSRQHPKDTSGSSTSSEGEQSRCHLQSGSESGSEESCPSIVSHIASCREVRWPRGLIPMGWMTLCLQGKHSVVGEET